MSDLQVLIVGAGPTGLALATELSRLGVSYRLIDRSPQPAQWSQALVVQARTLEQFERYGIAETAVARGRKIHKATIFSEHKPVLQFDFDAIHSRYSYVLLLPQSETERLFIEHLAEWGGQVERGVEFVSFSEQENGIEALLRHADGQTEQIRAQWMVGCDGAHSLVRQQIGVSFEGNTVDFVFFLGDLNIAGRDVPGDEVRIYLHRGNVVFIGRLSDTSCRVIVALHEQQKEHGEQSGAPESELTVADFQKAVEETADPRMRLSDPTWMTRFRINQRKAKPYRIGHAFLAGDASHIHSPVGGQGMNTGIQDAANLAWKLAAVMNGAPAALLDTYEEERGAVGDALLEITSRGLAAATTANPVLETVRDYVLRWLGGFSYIQEQARGFFSETAIQYRHSSIVNDCGGGSALHAGDRAPDAIYLDGSRQERRLYERLAAPQHTLLLLHVSDRHQEALAAVWPKEQMLALHPYPDEPLAQVYDGKGEPVIYAIRPDGYIGFRGSLDDADALAAYARRVGVRGDQFA
jgi:2-polyprenyl-6-methoxyphenol hydroxylase-like FAD-dependent oxidoreductase